MLVRCAADVDGDDDDDNWISWLWSPWKAGLCLLRAMAQLVFFLRPVIKTLQNPILPISCRTHFEKSSCEHAFMPE